MEAKEFDAKYRKRLEKLATTNLSDACDKVGIRAAVLGIRPAYDCPKIVGRAVTVKITAAGMMKSKHHLGVGAIHAAEPGDVICMDNRGDVYNNCWGEVLSMGAKMKGVSGVVVVPHDKAEEVLKIAKEIDEIEQSILQMLDRGMTMREARKQTGYHKLQTKR